MRVVALIALSLLPWRPALAQDEEAPVLEEPSGSRADRILAMAEARLGAGDGGLAIEALERFLEMHPYDPRAAEVAAQLSVLRKAKTRVRIESQNVQASVWMGQTRVAAETPAEIELPEGAHRLVVMARDGRSIGLDVVLPPASKRTLEVIFPGDFDPQERERFGVGGSLVVEVPAETPPDPNVARNRRRIVVLAGVSASTLVAGAVFGMMALSDEEEYRRSPSMKVANRGERLAMATDVSIGIAIVTGVTALVLKLKNREKKKAGAVALVPEVDRHGGGLVLRGAL